MRDEKSTVKLKVVQGYGTKNNPYVGGTEYVIDVPDILKENETVYAIVVNHQSEPDENNRVSAGSHTVPVIPYEFVNGLVGMVMPLVEASFADLEQRKAFKDLLMQKIWQWYESKGSVSLV